MSVRRIVFYGDYFENFYEGLNEKTKRKFDYVLRLIANVEMIPDKFLKNMERTHGLYEIRIEARGNAYRIFGLFDEKGVIVLLNTFQKKSQKTPKSEFALAERLRKQYFREK
jgi:phage-related protein